MTDGNGRVTNFQDNSFNRNFSGIAVDDRFTYLTSQAHTGFIDSSLMQVLTEVDHHKTKHLFYSISPQTLSLEDSG